MIKRANDQHGSLEHYHAKRDFAHSPEPTGQEPEPPRDDSRRLFCVQKHLASSLHYDLRLEHRGVLLSWAVPKGPSLDPAAKRLAMMTEDHPLTYGSFEGVIPEGYGAGIVLLWDRGYWEPEPGYEDVDAAIDKGELKFRIEGVKLKGSWVLIRTKSRGKSDGDDESRSWLLIKHRDGWAGELDIAAFAPRSVKSEADFADILAAEDPAVWESHRNHETGSPAGRQKFRKIVSRALALKQENLDAEAAEKKRQRDAAQG